MILLLTVKEEVDAMFPESSSPLHSALSVCPGTFEILTS
jgi:hypothetical protein